MNRTSSAAMLGIAFGAGTSLVNALSSPYSLLGAPLDGTLWGGAAKVLSLLVDSGWAWAALAVGVGWLVSVDWPTGAARPAGVGRAAGAGRPTGAGRPAGAGRPTGAGRPAGA
ncbi:hypothetical protein ACFSKW_11590, partial [Nonomuraea mangrovi]